ncbi:MAG: hypothetical protein GY778_05185 [bacterium]|nr:hypothetical protein [bacterium]
MTSRNTNPTRRMIGGRIGIAATLLVTVLVGSDGQVRGEDEQSPGDPSGSLIGRPQPAAAKIGDLAWIQGHWASKFGPNELHEIWSPPGGGCMMASFRWIKEGQVWMYELLTMVEQDETIVLRFKHFSRELHGWEEKDEALTLVLVKLEENLAVFENPGGKPSRMAFHKESDTRLTVRVGGNEQDESSGLVIKYQQAK